MRFRTMRDYDSRMRVYASNLCAAIPDPVDLTPVLARITALEIGLADAVRRIGLLETKVQISIDSLSGLTWEIVNTTTYTVTSHNVGLLVDTSTNAVQITLPNASDYDGESIYIKDNSGNAGTNNITLVPFGSNTIDDDSSLVIDADYTGVEIKSNGSGWEIV